MTWNDIEQGHWSKPHPDHHEWQEMWSSWRFEMTDDQTAAVPTQDCRWIFILAWQGLEKEVTSQSSLESGAQKFWEMP